MGDLYSFATGDKIPDADTHRTNYVDPAYGEQLEGTMVAEILADTSKVSGSRDADAATARMLAQLFGKIDSNQSL